VVSGGQSPPQQPMHPLPTAEGAAPRLPPTGRMPPRAQIRRAGRQAGEQTDEYVAAVTIIFSIAELCSPPPLQAHHLLLQAARQHNPRARPRSDRVRRAARDRGDARDEILRHRRLLLQRPVEESGTGVDNQQRPLRHRAPPDPPRGRSRRGQLEGALRQDRTERRHVQELDERC
jgi:hypothetical protein